MVRAPLWLVLQSSVTPAAPSDLRLQVIAGPTVVLQWTDSDTDETGYSIERRDVTASGAFAAIDSVVAGIETYDDVGPFTAKHTYEYRLTIVGGTLAGQHSNTAQAFKKVFGSRGIGISIGLGL